jgi:hypothetical protein
MLLGVGRMFFAFGMVALGMMFGRCAVGFGGILVMTALLCSSLAIGSSAQRGLDRMATWRQFNCSAKAVCLRFVWLRVCLARRRRDVPIIT